MAMMPSARVIAPRMAAHVGALKVCLVGLLLITSGLVVLAQLGTESSYWLLLAGLVPLGAGMGLAMTPATTAITDALPAAKQGVGSAVNDLARELGGALGIAVLGSLLQSTYRSNLGLDGVPEPLAEQARSSLVLAGRLGPAVAHDAQAAFTDGLQVALLCAAGAVALAAVGIAALLHGDKDRPSPDADLELELSSARDG
jgi:fucose permease